MFEIEVVDRILFVPRMECIRFCSVNRFLRKLIQLQLRANVRLFRTNAYENSTLPTMTAQAWKPRFNQTRSAASKKKHGDENLPFTCSFYIITGLI